MFCYYYVTPIYVTLRKKKKRKTPIKIRFPQWNLIFSRYLSVAHKTEEKAFEPSSTDDDYTKYWINKYIHY